MDRRDRFGLGFRPELAAAIVRHADRLDVVEALADDWIGESRARQRSLASLGRSVAVSLHGVSLGLASREPVQTRRLDALARLVERARPDSWSEHLAFVRGGGIEVGHLAAPPRTEATMEATARNAATTRRIVGIAPRLENVATLVDPPGSSMSEPDWIAATIVACGTDLLLDLHNLHCNADNFGFDAIAAIRALPPDRIASVHLAGGRLLPEGRILDDHLHDVPDAVYVLLEEVGAHATRGLDVILERDGHYPPFEALLAEIDKARGALARGRGRAASVPAAPPRHVHAPAPHVSEAQLARLYTDEAYRALCLADPESHGFPAALDRAGIEMAAGSYAAKRRAKGMPSH